MKTVLITVVVIHRWSLISVSIIPRRVHPTRAESKIRNILIRKSPALHLSWVKQNLELSANIYKLQTNWIHYGFDKPPSLAVVEHLEHYNLQIARHSFERFGCCSVCFVLLNDRDHGVHGFSLALFLFQRLVFRQWTKLFQLFINEFNWIIFFIFFKYRAHKNFHPITKLLKLYK